jgi:hypothetical protein
MMNFSTDPICGFDPLLEWVRAREPGTAQNFDVPGSRNLAGFRELQAHKARIEKREEAARFEQARKDGLLVEQVARPKIESTQPDLGESHPLFSEIAPARAAYAEHCHYVNHGTKVVSFGMVGAIASGLVKAVTAVANHYVWLEKAVRRLVDDLNKEHTELKQRFAALEKIERERGRGGAV